MRSASYLIRKHSRLVEFSVPRDEGSYDENARYIPASRIKLKTRALITHLTSDDLRLYEAGTYTSKDVKVKTCWHGRLPIRTQFTWQGSPYEVAEITDDTHLVDVCTHIAVCKGGDAG